MRILLPALFMLLPVLAFAQVKRTNPPTLSTPTGYTHIVEVTGPNRTIYISGQIAYDKDGKVVGAGDMKAQAEQVFKNLESALTAAGREVLRRGEDEQLHHRHVEDAGGARRARALLQGRHAGQHVRPGGRPRAAGTAPRDRSRRRRRQPADHETARRIAAVAGCLGVSLAAQPTAVPPGESLALVNANVVNVRDGRVTSGATIVMRGGRIESVGTSAPPAGVRTLDLKGKYLLPGLIDAHTHAADFPSFRRALESGVTTVRSAGVSNYADVGFHQLVKSGAMAGPDVLTAGYHVRPQMAQEAFLSDPSYVDLMAGVTTIEKLRRAVQMNLAHGVDWIKILATERAGTADTDPRKQVYTEDEMRAIVQEAETKNVPVEAHAHGDEGAMAAVKAGVRSIEHGTYLSDATLQLMKDRGTYLDPTYTTVIDSDRGRRRLRRAGPAHPRRTHAAAPARHDRPGAPHGREDRDRKRHGLRAEQPDADRPGSHPFRRDGLHAAARRFSRRRWSTPNCCGSRSRSAWWSPAMKRI